MKIKPEHLAELRRMVSAYDTPALRHAARSMGWTAPSYHYWLCGKSCIRAFICGTLYTYLKDTHIDTAMRHIIPEI